MLIVSNIKEEGIYNFDSIFHIWPVKIDKTYSLQFSGDHGIGYMGEWISQEDVDKALEEIIKGYHMGNKAVYL